jgi:hypothetical protein
MPRKGKGLAMRLIKTAAQHLMDAERAASRRAAELHASRLEVQTYQAAAAQTSMPNANAHDTSDAERQF